MITLFQFAPLWGLPNVSPFCMKLESYLRLTNMPYQVKMVGDTRRAPQGKAPFISDDGLIVADSGLIVDYLKHKYGDPLDSHLNDFRRAQGLALQRLFEEHLYWVTLYSRWVDDVNWPVVKKAFFQRAPGLLRGLIAYRVRKNIQTELRGHGMGLHTKDEIYQLGLEDLKALKAILGEQPYLLGDIITSIDATGYGFLANIIDVPIESPLKEYASSLVCFRDYCARVKAACGFD